MQTIQRSNLLLTLITLASIVLSACGSGESDATPTFDVGSLQTSVVATLSAGLTQTALARPTATVVPTNTPSPQVTFAPLPTSGTALPPGGNVSPTASCYRLTFVKDVTIPDNTAMTPGQSFTKTWKVRNTGTCAWEAGFKFAFTGGDAMSGATYTLPQAATANTELDLSIAMVAPNKTGTARGNWRMSTASGQYFGDEVYVIINVGGSTVTATQAGATSSATNSLPVVTATGTPTSTATATATATATPTTTSTP